MYNANVQYCKQTNSKTEEIILTEKRLPESADQDSFKSKSITETVIYIVFKRVEYNDCVTFSPA